MFTSEEMATRGKLLCLHILANILQFLFILEASKPDGLSIKLIHRDSPESPFYPGNITRSERIHLQIQTASAYVRRLSADIRTTSNQTITTTSIRPKLDNQGLMYMVAAGIGTFSRPRSPYYKYFLHLDTGSDLMWTQCDACRKLAWGSCFLQKAPLFPARLSRSYRPLQCDRHPLCFPGQCINTTCSYLLRYGDGATTIGYLAYEHVTFGSDNNRIETVKDVVFGCGIKSHGFLESSKNNLIAGNFGLGRGKLSFLTQKSYLTQGRFSYCLPPFDSAHNSTSFLRFGADIPRRNGLRETPLLTNQHFSSYFVELKGISVGNRKLDISARMLSRRNHYGGCTMDSGSTYTVMPPPVYEKLKEMLIKNHFSRYTKTRNLEILSLCYLFPGRTGLKDLPNITFHLQDSDLVFPPHAGYIVDRTILGKEYFCLGMFPENVYGIIIIGALQQANTRLIFDTLKKKLYFGPEDCTLGA